MNRLEHCLVLSALLAAGCAATAPEVAHNASAPATQDDTETETIDEAEVLRTISLTAADTDTSSVITCRDIRPLGSNVLVTRCMTRADWEKFERMQTIQAQEWLRRIRGEY